MALAGGAPAEDEPQPRAVRVPALGVGGGRSWCTTILAVILGRYLNIISGYTAILAAILGRYLNNSRGYATILAVILVRVHALGVGGGRR